MSVQQNVVAVHVESEAAFAAARDQLARQEDVRAIAVPAEDGSGWVMLLESHLHMPEELLALAQQALGEGGLKPYSMTNDERLRLLAGNDPLADAARG